MGKTIADRRLQFSLNGLRDATRILSVALLTVMIFHGQHLNIHAEDRNMSATRYDLSSVEIRPFLEDMSREQLDEFIDEIMNKQNLWHAFLDAINTSNWDDFRPLMLKYLDEKFPPPRARDWGVGDVFHLLWMCLQQQKEQNLRRFKRAVLEKIYGGTPLSTVFSPSQLQEVRE
jgi:hypothetical protein